MPDIARHKLCGPFSVNVIYIIYYTKYEPQQISKSAVQCLEIRYGHKHYTYLFYIEHQLHLLNSYYFQSHNYFWLNIVHLKIAY